MRGGGDPQDRLNHLQTGRGGETVYTVRRGVKKTETQSSDLENHYPFYCVLSCPLDTSFPCTWSKLCPLSTSAIPLPRRPARLALLAENGDSLPSGPLSEGRKCRFVPSQGVEGSW